MSLPGKNSAEGKTTLDASAGKPWLAKALSTTPVNPSRVIVTVGTPCFSTSAAARPLSREQDPQAALPTTAA
jgi:hypothetical protein